MAFFIETAVKTPNLITKCLFHCNFLSLRFAGNIISLAMFATPMTPPWAVYAALTVPRTGNCIKAEQWPDEAKRSALLLTSSGTNGS
jgi:hypothetical protein